MGDKWEIFSNRRTYYFANKNKFIFIPNHPPILISQSPYQSKSITNLIKYAAYSKDIKSILSNNPILSNKK